MMMVLVEERIQKAIAAGEFANLPGKGKPLHLDENPWEDPEWRIANHLLKSNGFSLPWIETRREIEGELDAARAMLKRAWDHHQQAVRGEQAVKFQAGWERAVVAFRNQVESLNRRILSYNLEVPAIQFQRRTIQVEREIQALTGEI